MRARIAPLLVALGTFACGGEAPPPASPSGVTAVVAPPTPPLPPAPKAPRAASPQPASASAVTFARMAKHPEPGWSVPSQLSFVPGTRKIAYLASEQKNDVLSLFEYDEAQGATKVLLRAQDLVPKAGEAISKEEELRRERQRLRTKGITSYAFAKQGGRLVVPFAGDVYLRESDGRVRALTATKEPELDPKICASGEKVVYVRGPELYAYDLASSKEVALTRGAKAHVTRGQSDYNAQEEFGEPSGFFLSPDCKSLVFLEVDDAEVDELVVPGYRAGEARFDAERYPLAGGKNPKVSVYIAPLAGGAPRKVTLPGMDGRYLVSFSWEPTSAAFSLQAVARDQRSVSFVRVDARSLATSVREIASDRRYVEALPMKRLEGSSGFVSIGVTGGHGHLELRDGQGAVEKVLTQGAWDVTQISAIDEKNRVVYFVGTKDSPLERNLYAVPLAGGEVRRVTPEPGVHVPVVDAETGRYLDVHSARNRPPAVELRGAKGEKLHDLTPPKDPEIEALGIRPLEPFTAYTKDGTLLHGNLLRPRRQEPGRLYPVVVMVYGGPGVQAVQNKFAPKLLWQHLADRGFFVLQVDNRGSAGRGHEFASVTYGKLGQVELEDQLDALEALKSMEGVDPTRVGIYGVSYGGTMVLNAMLRAPGKYKAGIADASVVDWSYYDSGYTERYLGPKGPAYTETELSQKAAALQGKLLVMHGLMDENVHFANSAKLVDALVAAQKPFDMVVLPGERHGTKDPAAKEWVSRKIAEYFADALR